MNILHSRCLLFYVLQRITLTELSVFRSLMLGPLPHAFTWRGALIEQQEQLYLYITYYHTLRGAIVAPTL
jgi:hypothetical protein